MSCGHYSFFGILRSEGHAVTLVGYDSSQGLQIMYWNSATARLESSTYQPGLTYIVQSGKSYRWDGSVLAKYY